MNEVYFACLDNKTFVDIGYRWAYWELEHTGVVKRGRQINVEEVLNAAGYWNPPADSSSKWLYEEVFPSVRKFLEENRRFQIIYGEYEDFISIDDLEFLEWKQEKGWLQELSPRLFFEDLGIDQWDDVELYVSRLSASDAPWWWGLPDVKLEAQKFFDILVSGKEAGH